MGLPLHKGTGATKWATGTWAGTSGSVSYASATSGTPESGDLCILWIVKDDDVAVGTPTDSGATWQLQVGGESLNAIYGQLYAKIADGNEGTSVSWTSDSEEGVAFLTVFKGGSLYSGKVDGSAALTDITTSSMWANDSTRVRGSNPSISHTDPTVWIGFGGWDSNSVATGTPAPSVTSFPTNWIDEYSGTGAGSAGGALGEVHQEIGENLGSGVDIITDIDDSEQFVGTTIALRGFASVLGYLPTAPTPTLRDTTPPTATADATSITINKPDNTADGDLLVAIINYDAEGTARTFSATGWEYIGAIESATPNIGIYILTKTASSEPSSWTFTVSGTSGSMAGEVHAIANGGWRDWYDGVGYETSSATTDTGSLSQVKGLIFGSFAGGDFGPTRTWTVDTDLTEISDTTRYFANLATGYRTESSPTNVGPYTGTSDAAQNPRAAVVWAVGPAPGFTLDAELKKTVTGYTNLARQIDYRTGTGSGAAVNVEVPTHSEGDLLVAFIAIFENSTNRTLTPPDGWTQRWDEQRLGDQERLWTFTKTASSSEPASYTFSASGGVDAIGVMVSIENAEWVDGNASGTDSGSGTTSTTPTLSGEQGIFYGVHDSLVDTPWTATHSAPYEEVVAVQNLFSGSTYHVLSVGKAESLTTTSNAVSTLTWSESTGKVNTIFVAYSLPTLGIAVDAIIAQGTFKVDAVLAPKRFFVDASIQRTVRGGEEPITIGTVATTGTDYGTNRTWTHTFTSNAKAIVVLLGSYNSSDVTSVTYGNKALTERRYQGGQAGMHIFSLTDLSGRDDDVVRVTGATQTGGSVLLDSDANIEYYDSQGTAYATGLNGTALTHTYAQVGGGYGAGAYIAGMEDSLYATYMTDITGMTGLFTRGGSNEGFRAGAAAKYTIGVDISSNDWVGLASVWHTSAGTGFTLDAVIRFPEGDFVVDAIRGETFTFEPGFTLDYEWIPAYFLVDASIFAAGQQSFTIRYEWVPKRGFLDAVLLSTIVFEPGFTLDYEWTPGGSILLEAVITRWMTSQFHHDTMSATEVDTWGSPDIGEDYTYSDNQALFDKASGVATVGPSKNVYPYVYFNDEDLSLDQEYFVRWGPSGRGNLNSQDHKFGLNNRVYLNYHCTNNNSSGTPDFIRLYVDGVQRGIYYLPAKYNASYPRLAIRVRSVGSDIKAKVWDKGGGTSEPDWQIEYDASAVGYSGASTRSYYQSNFSSYFGTEGPFTFYLDDLSLTSLQIAPITVDAYLAIVTITPTPFTVDAQVGWWFGADAFIKPYFRLDAELIEGFRTLDDFLVRAVVTEGQNSGSSTLDAEVVARTSVDVFAYIGTYREGSFALDAFLLGGGSGSATVDAQVYQPQVLLNAIIGTITHPQNYFAVRAELTTKRFTVTGFTLDAGIDSAYGEQFTIDASLIEFTKEHTFTLAADMAGPDEVRGTATLDAACLEAQQALFRIDAISVQVQPVMLEAWLAGTISLDAEFVSGEQTGSYTAEAWLAGTHTQSLRADAVIADASGDYRGFRADALVVGTVERPGLYIIEVLASIVTDPENPLTGSFTLDAVRETGGSFGLDAQFYRPLFLNAYVESTNFVVYPPAQDGDGGVTSGTSQEGTDGLAVTGTTFQSASADFTGMEGAAIIIDGTTYTIESVTNSTTVVISGGTIAGSSLTWSIPTLSDSEASFDDTYVGSTIVIEGIVYTIIDVVDENTVIVGGTNEWPYANGGISWEVPSGDPTDPLGGSVPITRSFQVLIEWSRPDKESWTDMTGDVIWRTASFTQSARVGPGTFEMTLKGAFSQYVGGEEIRVSIDGYRVFGGYVTDVERGYIFEDDYSVPTVTLKGVDYNVLLDRLLIYNAAWDNKREGSGPYKTWKAFAQGTLDRDIILTVARRYMTDPGLLGLDFTTNVDEIETPAPTTRFQMESGMSLRNLLTEISRITEGVWWISPYKELHYHSRTNVTAPYPISDSAGGIACRGLSISTSLSVMSNDVFVWGTQAHMDTGDSDIIYSRQTADQDWDVEWWTTKLERVQAKIDRITQTPYNQRTLKQRTTLAALRDTKQKYQTYLSRAQATTEEGSLSQYGRWQYGEYRNDIYQQGKVDRRAKAIMQRYSEPVVKAEATVFDPGFQAGQVVNLVSATHDVAEDIVIRQVELSFVVSKEPVGDRYYAVPTYRLSLGLDPEEPWNIYQFLPFPDLDDTNTHYNWPKIRIPDIDWGDPDAPDKILDNFQRTYASTEDLGPSTSERDEYRPWEPT